MADSLTAYLLPLVMADVERSVYSRPPSWLTGPEKADAHVWRWRQWRREWVDCDAHVDAFYGHWESEDVDPDDVIAEAEREVRVKVEMRELAQALEELTAWGRQFEAVLCRHNRRGRGSPVGDCYRCTFKAQCQQEAWTWCPICLGCLMDDGEEEPDG